MHCSWHPFCDSKPEMAKNRVNGCNVRSPGSPACCSKCVQGLMVSSTTQEHKQEPKVQQQQKQNNNNNNNNNNNRSRSRSSRRSNNHDHKHKHNHNHNRRDSDIDHDNYNYNQGTPMRATMMTTTTQTTTTTTKTRTTETRTRRWQVNKKKNIEEQALHNPRNAKLNTIRTLWVLPTTNISCNDDAIAIPLWQGIPLCGLFFAFSQPCLLTRQSWLLPSCESAWSGKTRAKKNRVTGKFSAWMLELQTVRSFGTEGCFSVKILGRPSLRSRSIAGKLTFFSQISPSSHEMEVCAVRSTFPK